MANIQSSINQTISLASLLASQSPAYKAAAEKRIQLKDIEKREGVLKEQLQLHNKKLTTEREEWEAIKQEKEPTEQQIEARNVQRAALEQESERLNEEATRLAEEKYRINPTRKTYEEYSELKIGEERMRKDEEQELEWEREEKEEQAAAVTREKQAREAADAKLAAIAAEKRETRRRILEGTPSEYLLRQKEVEQ